MLLEAGFSQPSTLEVPLVWRLPSPDALLDAFMEGGVRTRALLLAQAPAALVAIREGVREAAREYRAGTGIELPMPCVLSSGIKA